MTKQGPGIYFSKKIIYKPTVLIVKAVRSKRIVFHYDGSISTESFSNRVFDGTITPIVGKLINKQDYVWIFSFQVRNPRRNYE